jgi:hypothetical protein
MLRNPGIITSYVEPEKPAVADAAAENELLPYPTSWASPRAHANLGGPLIRADLARLAPGLRFLDTIC